jgi:3-methylcrotonyl-CoA carboxylase alpha subunit
MSIHKLLIANRGEIVVRIIRTCRRLGIATVAVYSDVDRDALHVREADEAIRLGPAPANESYLNIPAILAAAQTSGADAIHPGYGFLSENAAFAQAVLDAGLIWVGPSPEAIRLLGSKIAAKELAQRVGVPTVPGYWSADGPADAALLVREAARIGFPVLLKASAGGGGKGMRVVETPEEFAPALEGAQREAQAAFGDPTVFLERYILAPRHIEIQIIGDTHGTVLHVGERECSIQRRHQKVLEESPSPAPQMTPAKRAEMGAQAVALAQAAGYTNAGTVEFIMDAEGNHYFLEVNTRLQVEHPVTEMVTGIDLVEWQLLVAQGDPLPRAQEDIHQNGHAVEVRIYAEDPLKGFLPSTGRITTWDPGCHWNYRLDSGVQAPSKITIYYDPQLAKMIVHEPTREQAVQKLATYIADFEVEGITTNLGFLFWLTQHPEFRAGRTNTGFIDQHWHPSRLTDATPPPDEVLLAIVAEELGYHDPFPHWTPAVMNPWHSIPVSLMSQEIVLDYEYIPPGFTPEHGNAQQLPITARRQSEYANNWHIQFLDTALEVAIEPGRQYGVRVILPTLNSRQLLTLPYVDLSLSYDRRLYLVSWEGQIYRLLRPRSLSTDTLAGAIHLPSENSLQAPMPGKVIQVLVQEGEAVEENARLVVMEAMKMEFTIRAPHTGRVRRLPVREGQLVDAGAVLVEIE